MALPDPSFPQSHREGFVATLTTLANIDRVARPMSSLRPEEVRAHPEKPGVHLATPPICGMQIGVINGLPATPD